MFESLDKISQLHNAMTITFLLDIYKLCFMPILNLLYITLPIPLIMDEYLF